MYKDIPAAYYTGFAAMLADEYVLIFLFTISSGPGRTFSIELLYITSTSVRYCAAVRADRITEYQHSSKP